MKYKGLTLQQNKNCKTWYTRVREHGEQKYIRGKTLRDLRQNVKAYFDRLENKKLNNKLTFKTWYEKWLNTYKINTVRETTIKGYFSSLKHIPEKILNKDIDKVAEVDVLKILNSIPQARNKQKMYIFLHDILSKAYSNRLTDINCFATLKKPDYEAGEQIALTREETKQFLKANTYKNRNFFLLILYEGLRPGECLALQPEDIDLEKMTLTINKSINPGTKDTRTKNKTSNRTVPIFKNALPILKELKKNKPGERIFKVCSKTIQEELERVLSKTNIREITPRNLRHTFITRCSEANIPEFVFQTWVGHQKGSKVTKQTYTHLNSDTNLKYINILNNTTL